MIAMEVVLEPADGAPEWATTVADLATAAFVAAALIVTVVTLVIVVTALTSLVIRIWEG